MIVSPDGISVVHQVLPSLHVADASGSHTLRVRNALLEAGYASELFVGQVDAPLADQARPFESLDDFVDPGRTVILYQLAVGSVLVERLLRRREPIFVNYHNLTPAEFFWKWAPDWLNAVETGRQQLHRLAPRVSHAIAVSEFNRRDLLGAGYTSTSVVPPFVDFDGRPCSSASEAEEAEEADRPPVRRARWIFVGKLLPHKAPHDLVKALAAYRRAYDPEATLTLVGGHPVASYATAVRSYAAALGLSDAVDLAGSVSDEQLASAYGKSDAFVCLSDHEGFCFPLLEAMSRGLPIVAFDAGAVGDTLGGAGVLLREKDPATVASAVHLVLTDGSLRARIRSAGHVRLAELDPIRTKRMFLDQLRVAIGRL